MKRVVILILFIVNALHINAQELNCQVSVNHSQVQGTDVRVFQTLQKAIFEFMNNRRWTDRVFKAEERIECSVFI